MIKLTISITAIFFIIANLVVAQDKDLVAYWTFDEGAGRTVKDIVGNHDGTFVGDPKWVQGKFGKALEFDGKASYVKVPDAPDLSMELDVTYSVWFKPTVTINSGNSSWRMISKNNDYFLLFNYEQLGQLGWLIKDPTGTNHVVHSKTNEWLKDTWYHAAGTFDGKELKIYVNGSLENTLQWSGKAGTSKLDLWIGADDYPNYFPGAIDDFRIYKRVLNEAEIKKAMSAPAVAVRSNGSIISTWAKVKEGDFDY
ncbi:TPA: LamG domain-containing protein [Candidatus Poribacteria bacterium]|nr:LamG domain-containing protein [Candidatus Poribacteria bacterium]